jgi:hypothetical protein
MPAVSSSFATALPGPKAMTSPARCDHGAIGQLTPPFEAARPAPPR